MKYRIMEFFDEDYGCEGIPEGEDPMCCVLAVDDDGNVRRFRLSESCIAEKGIAEGTIAEL